MKRSSGVVSRHAEESKTVPDDQLACPAQKWSNSGTVTVSSMMGLYVCVIFIISTGVVARLILECMPKPLYNRIVPAKWRTAPPPLDHPDLHDAPPMKRKGPQHQQHQQHQALQAGLFQSLTPLLLSLLSP